MQPIKIEYPRDQAAKIADLEAKRARVTTEANALDEERRQMAGADPSTLPPATDPAAARIATLLGEAAPAVVKDHRTRLAEMAQRSRDLRQASDLLAEQIRVERHKAAVEARIKLAPEYARRIRTVCEAFKTAHVANVALHELIAAMEDAGIEWGTLGHVGPKQLGSPRDPYGPIGIYLKDACDLGFITTSDIPKELRQ
jgi:hypothetical protein